MSPRGTPPPERLDLVRAEDRMSFLYVERTVIHRDGNALTLTDERGVIHVPASALGALMLGPGTRITHAAMGVAGDAGVSITWVGEHGTRYYAHGRPLAKSSRNAEAQARIVSNQRLRLRTARAMYSMRFPGEDVSVMSMSQLRGREGARMKRLYAAEAERTGVPWKKRSYAPDDFDSGDDINRALTSSHAALYGVVHAVIVSLGFVPSLGVVHNGTDRSLVYDIADLYKAEVSIPAAFDSVASGADDVVAEARRAVRDRVVRCRLLPRAVRDIHVLFDVEPDPDFTEADLLLWSELEAVPSGSNWADAW
ncbi:type I-E CRISPR-associated endonuclease Cas1e [Brachybacterium sp. p3-SID957]|uniref:type I-E CRISPR-associated endonuclease Cas1e n=1 Tax=Brachybacterium sp. p3-SID957 TaxID=2916049 RepID=UPI00223A909F|nr:type I-E CRISPR-associated endonuclease Cas1e [Brachybacterium sp. p3-SID957]